MGRVRRLHGLYNGFLPTRYSRKCEHIPVLFIQRQSRAELQSKSVGGPRFLFGNNSTSGLVATFEAGLMGFFKSLLDEAGKKTGSAIGNTLFRKSTDYHRIGRFEDDLEEQLEAEQEAFRERMEMEQAASLMQSVLNYQFDARDLEHNIAVLTQLDAIIDALPARIFRSEMEQKVYKMAKSKIQSGIAISKRIAPGSQTIAYFENKY